MTFIVNYAFVPLNMGMAYRLRFFVFLNRQSGRRGAFNSVH